mgnify:CR=1 FL=1
MSFEQTARWLLVFSAAALILAPVVMMLGAFSASSCMMALALFIMGALGLYAGMRAVNREK